MGRIFYEIVTMGVGRGISGVDWAVCHEFAGKLACALGVACLVSAMPTLNWIGKEAVITHHQEVPYRLLEPDPFLGLEKGEGGDGGNLIVEGDNLHALKALLPRYAGQVKCIYIDPPYNTGNEGWIYNDNVNSPEIRRWIADVIGKEAAKVGKEGEDLSRHDKWLCMMYPRLNLLKKFLRDDGVIIVHIDENEAFALSHLMDEIFGPQNRLGEIVWDKGNPKGDSTRIAYQHETIMCYARSISFLNASGKWFGRKKPNADKIMQKAAKLFKCIGKSVLPEDLAKIGKKYKLASTVLEAIS